MFFHMYFYCITLNNKDQIYQYLVLVFYVNTSTCRYKRFTLSTRIFNLHNKTVFGIFMYRIRGLHMVKNLYGHA